MPISWQRVSTIIATPVAIGALIYFATLLAIVYWLAGAPPWLYIVTFLPTACGTAVAYHIHRSRNWRTTNSRRLTKIFQGTAAVFFLQPIVGILIGLSHVVFNLDISNTDGIKFFLLTKLQDTSPWVSVCLSVLGVLCLFLSWYVAVKTPISQPTPSIKQPTTTLPLVDDSDNSIIDVEPLDPNTVRRAKNFRSYDADHPPEVTTWVGRADHLSLVEQMPFGVVAITGIGGQGKSALASKILDNWRNANPDHFWDWRDCREQGELFLTQLYSLITRVSLEKINVSALASYSPAVIAKFFFKLMRNSTGMIVLDNVDHYVDVERSTLTGPLGVFVQEALRSRSRLKIVLTCRPHISYSDINFREIPLIGLSEDEAIQLFRNKRVSHSIASDDQVKAINRLTQGHAFWLTILASELERKQQGTIKLISQLEAGQAELDRMIAMLRPIWSTINDREKSILLSLSECRKPLTEKHLHELLKERIKSANQFNRAIRAVVAYGLVTKKPVPGADSVYELHPVVRQFLRTDLHASERQPFIRLIASGTKDYILRIEKSKVSSFLTIEDFEFATVNIESHLQSGNIEEAAKSMIATSDFFVIKNLLHESIRLSELILERADWQILEKHETKLHDLILNTVDRYVDSGMESSMRTLVSKYDPHRRKDTPFRIAWESSLCRAEWMFRNYDLAILHGRKGVSLKTQSKIDTQADASNNLHLALRDSGAVDEALAFFLRGFTVDAVLKADFQREPRGSSWYGNIGRCLFLKGNIDTALQLYARSWRLLETDDSRTSYENRGWAGIWIAEAFISQNNYSKAALFCAYARDVWQERLPLKIADVHSLAKKLPSDADLPTALLHEQTKRSCDAEISWLLK